MSKNQVLAEQDEGELSIGDFLRYAWAKRLLLFTVPCLFACLALGVSIFRAAIPPTVTFYIELQSIKNGEYPNGSKFSPGDLTVPEVVEVLRTKFGHSFTQEDFAKGVVVEYGSPLVRPLLQRYEILLSNKQLKPNEFDELSNKLATELRGISQRGLRIQVDPMMLSLTRDQAVQLALDVPLYWSKFFIEKYNILLNQDILDSSITVSSFDASSVEDILRTSDIISKADKGLTRLLVDHRLQQLKTASGLSIADVSFAVRNFDLLFMRPLLNNLQQGEGASRVRVYQQDALIRMQETESRISGLDETINSLPMSRDARGGNAFLAGGSNAGIQLTDAGVSQLLRLGQQNAMSGYLQELLTQRNALVEERARRQAELERYRKEIGLPMRIDLSAATKNFERVISEYRSLYDQAVLKLQRDNRFLYSGLGAPTVAGRSNLYFLLMATIGACLLGLFLTTSLMFVRFLASQGQ